MPTQVMELSTHGAFRGAVDTQQEVLGRHATTVWHVPQLMAVLQCGGAVLGVWEDAPEGSSRCDGVLVDLPAEVDGYPARHAVVWLVRTASQGKGLGVRLRASERRVAQQHGVDLVFWGLDPLHSHGLHVSVNKLGGIVTGYVCDALGSLKESSAFGPATDQLRLEWWVDSPRVAERMDRQATVAVPAVKLNEMDVVTTTTLLPTGVRGLTGDVRVPASDHALVEIPEDYPAVVRRDRDAALYWRLRSREILEPAFEKGYIGVGVVRQAGRSFLYLRRSTRRTELSAS